MLRALLAEIKAAEAASMGDVTPAESERRDQAEYSAWLDALRQSKAEAGSDNGPAAAPAGASPAGEEDLTPVDLSGVDLAGLEQMTAGLEVAAMLEQGSKELAEFKELLSQLAAADAGAASSSSTEEAELLEESDGVAMSEKQVCVVQRKGMGDSWGEAQPCLGRTEDGRPASTALISNACLRTGDLQAR